MNRSLFFALLASASLGGCWYRSFSIDPSLDGSGGGSSTGGSLGGQGGQGTGGGGGGTMNLPLAAEDDRFTLDQGGSLTTGNVLDNDTGTSLRVTGFSATDANRPASIDADVLEVAEDGTISFTPHADFFGVYRVSYDVEDESGKSATGTLEFVVRPKNIKLSLIAAGYGGFVVDGAAGDGFGTSLSRALDVNKDGIADFVVGAPKAAGNSYAAIVYGKAKLESFAMSDPSLTGKVTVLGGPTSQTVGVSVSHAGDLNADGFADVLFGAPGSPGDAGAVFAVYGKASLGTNLDVTTFGVSAGYRIDGYSSAQIGKVVAGGTDINGDGKPDLLISGNYAVTGVSTDNDGSISAIFGPGVTGTLASQYDLTIHGTNASGRLDKDIAILGDIDKDGRGDVGAIGQQETLALRGLDPATDTPDAWPLAPNFMIAGDSAFGFKAVEGAAGARISGTGDFNKDGTNDLVYCASSSSCTFLVGKEDFDLSTDWNITGLVSAPVVDGNGDVNGDTYSDFVIADTARAYVILGREAIPTSDLSVLSLTKNEYVIEAEASTSIGQVALIGDVNGDGFGDIAVSAPAFSGSSGRVYVIFGQ